MSRKRGLVSIGTNSTRLLILDGERTVCARSTGTRIGRGLDRTGTIDPAAAAATLAAIDDYAAEIRTHAATVDAIATSALRRARDADAFGERVHARLGIAPRIISGDAEAAYSFAGATRSRPGADRVGVLDVGGGSSELGVGTAGRAERTISLEIGAVRLSERLPALLGATAYDAAERNALVAQAREIAEPILAPLRDFPALDALIGVGGTLFTAAGMLCGDPLRDGVRIDRGQRRELIDLLLARDLAARRNVAHIRPQRADILPAGLVVVDVACDALGIDALTVSHADLLAGYLHSPDYRPAELPPLTG